MTQYSVTRRVAGSVARVPWLGMVFLRLRGKIRGTYVPFDDSASYWERRYQRGLTSGAGSYGRLAEFKAEVLNGFVEENGIRSVIELGCGDGSQLRLARYPSYVGIDVSQSAVAMCRSQYAGDPTKSFSTDAAGRKGYDLSLSLDVIYHLVEDEVYQQYMRALFDASDRFAIIYSSDKNSAEGWEHVRHRRFTDWVAHECPEWALRARIPNRYPLRVGEESSTSFADFYVFEKVAARR